jgi:hypothetical protein
MPNEHSQADGKRGKHRKCDRASGKTDIGESEITFKNIMLMDFVHRIIWLKV